jgi:hypothetical protein
MPIFWWMEHETWNLYGAFILKFLYLLFAVSTNLELEHMTYDVVTFYG